MFVFKFYRVLFNMNETEFDQSDELKKETLKKIWKQEAEQQRRDNQKKQKIVKKREVDIKFGGVKEKNSIVTKQPSSTSKSPLSDSTQDDFSRSRLGLN